MSVRTYNPRSYTQIANKIGISLRNSLILRSKVNKKYPEIPMTIPITPKHNEIHNHKSKIRTVVPFQSSKSSQLEISSFKLKLKQQLEICRINEENRRGQLADEVEEIRYQMGKQRQRKMDEMRKRKRYEVMVIKEKLDQSREWLSRTKEKQKLQYTFKCLQRRANKKRINSLPSSATNLQQVTYI